MFFNLFKPIFILTASSKAYQDVVKGETGEIKAHDPKPATSTAPTLIAKLVPVAPSLYLPLKS